MTGTDRLDLVSQQAVANERVKENWRRRKAIEHGTEQSRAGEPKKSDWTREDETVLRNARAQDERKQKEAQKEMSQGQDRDRDTPEK